MKGVTITGIGAFATCECEHDSHFDGPNHRYGKIVKVSDMVTIRTPYGAFSVCKECDHDHPLPKVVP